MLQFFLGTTSINIDWITVPLFHTSVYNSPPIFFIAVFSFLATAFYNFRLRREIILFILAIGGLGIISALMHGFTTWHQRQIFAFAVSAVTWIYLYQAAADRDIFTLQRTRVILTAYAVAMVLMLTERFIFGSGHLVYLVSSIFSTHPEWLRDYAALSHPARLSYFSIEPSSAACAIAASIMPMVCARAAAEKSIPAYGMLLVAAVVLYFAEGMTGQLLLLFAIGFVFLPRAATYSVPVCLVGIAAFAATFASVLQDKHLLVNLLTGMFGGIWGRVDEGILSGSYVTRLGTWFIGAQTFLDAPILGQGLGGSGANFFTLANQGLDVGFSSEQQGVLQGEFNVFNAQMVVRIPAELGIIGTAIFLYFGWRAFRLAERARKSLPKLDHYAYLFSLGAMLVTFVTNGEYALPTIAAFVVLLAQTRRKLGEIKPLKPLASPATLEPGSLPA